MRRLFSRAIPPCRAPLAALALPALLVFACFVPPAASPAAARPGAVRPLTGARQGADAPRSACLSGEEAAEAEWVAEARQERGRLLERVGVEAWHARGHRGQGVKVAVLDSGFRGYREQLGKSLPPHVTAKSFRRDADLEARDSQHGILCGEVIHALAPDAELLFANWEPDDPHQFLEAVRWAREQGARVISCSMIMPAWGDGEGGGPVHAELARLIGGGDVRDVLCVASAGNTAKRHWSGPFRAAADGWHQWLPGQADNLLTPLGTERVSVELTWKSGPDYQVVVLGEDGKEVAASAAVPQAGRLSAAARFQPEKGRTYRVRVRRLSGEAGSFHCTALGGTLSFVDARGSVCFPADGPEVLAVGAVDAEGHRMAYSSCGPCAGGPKPDLVAPVPFPSLWRDKPFGGTSAAAPQTAALAALCLSRHPDWTPSRVREALCRSARQLGGVGPDTGTGYGVIRLPAE